MTSRQATGTTRCGSRSRSCAPRSNRGGSLARTGRCSPRGLPATSCRSSPTTSTPAGSSSWWKKRERPRRRTPRRPRSCSAKDWRRGEGVRTRSWPQVPRAGRDRSPRRAPDRGRRAAVGRRPALRASGELVAELQSLVHQHPLREHLDAQLMLALYRSDRQADALRAYGRLRRQLAEELGLDPSATLQRLEQQIICGDPVLDWLAAPPSHPPRSARCAAMSCASRSASPRWD